MKPKSKMLLVLAGVLCIPIVIYGISRGIMSISFNANCSGYLKRAADANTVDIAKKEVETALKYIEYNRMTEGSTAIFWKVPADDVGFWYKNIKSSHEELSKITENTSQLERTNVLMKLRETLTDSNKEGMHVTMPDNISVFPHNVAWFVFGLLCVFAILGGLGCVMLAMYYDTQY